MSENMESLQPDGGMEVEPAPTGAQMKETVKVVLPLSICVSDAVESTTKIV